jgi:hypothetical protein
LKIIEDVLGLRKCYQCGGETLVPVVKHSVSDSSTGCSLGWPRGANEPFPLHHLGTQASGHSKLTYF